MNRWLWRGGVGLLILILAVGLALVMALLMGFNSPRPIRPPDWQAADSPLTLEAAPHTTAVKLLGRSCDDFTLEIEAALISDLGSGFNGYGLVYRAQDDARYYVFTAGSDGYYAVLRVDGIEETPLVSWQQFTHVHRGVQANRLRADCAGTACNLYINDEYATTVEDGTWLDGDVGLWTRSFEDSAVTVRFKNARVWLK
ncbi:MAG: hypothetical protein JW918_02690 [Anaerolineae bacterium]|nr:hypothetical protein [Anaerolineae bacterium]